jgi:hypothetical protein
MEWPLAIKIVGGIIAGIAHRQLVRACREESFGWWMTALFVPGGTIIYGLRNRVEFARVLMMKFAGLTIVGLGFGLGVYMGVEELRHMDDHGELAGSELVDEEALENEPAETGAPTATLVVAQQNPVPAIQAAPVPLRLPGDLKERLSKHEKQHAKLIAERAALDSKNPEAVRKFNLRAKEYHEVRSRLEAEVAVEVQKAAASGSFSGTR